MYNPETLATLDTQDTGQRQTKQGAIKNVQSRDTGNIRYTRHRTKTNKTRGHQECTTQSNMATLDTQDTGQRQTKQGAIKNVQSRDTGNIRYTRHRTKTNKTRGHQEIQSTDTTQDTGQRQRKQGGHWQH